MVKAQTSHTSTPNRITQPLADYLETLLKLCPRKHDKHRVGCSLTPTCLQLFARDIPTFVIYLWKQISRTFCIVPRVTLSNNTTEAFSFVPI